MGTGMLLWVWRMEKKSHENVKIQLRKEGTKDSRDMLRSFPISLTAYPGFIKIQKRRLMEETLKWVKALGWLSPCQDSKKRTKRSSKGEIALNGRLLIPMTRTATVPMAQ